MPVSPELSASESKYSDSRFSRTKRQIEDASRNPKTVAVRIRDNEDVVKKVAVLESLKHVLELSEHVSIDHNAVMELADGLSEEDFRHWMELAPYDINVLDNEQKLGFLFVFNSLSFSYWGNPKWTVGYNGKLYDGTWAMIASIGKAIEEGRPILNPAYISDIRSDELETILRGNVRVPLFEERLRTLRELGTVVTTEYNGSYENVIAKARGDALKLLDVLVTDFPFFNDHAIYRDRHVYFHKRAQLLIADIWNAFKGKGYGKLINVDKITACADYKLPKVLRDKGVLRYSDTLAQSVDARMEIPRGSEEEIEIRANTVAAVELLREKLGKRFPGITSTMINDYLWRAGQVDAPDGKPYHMTRTTSY